MEGNQMNMRDALEFAAQQLVDATESDTYGDDVVYLVGCMLTVAEACRAALSAPPMQCDVGTAEEQEARWKDYCDDVTRGECPPSGGCNSCAIYWAQMPYAAEEGGAE